MKCVVVKKFNFSFNCFVSQAISVNIDAFCNWGLFVMHSRLPDWMYRYQRWDLSFVKNLSNATLCDQLNWSHNFFSARWKHDKNYFWIQQKSFPLARKCQQSLSQLGGLQRWKLLNCCYYQEKLWRFNFLERAEFGVQQHRKNSKWHFHRFDFFARNLSW